MRNILIILLLIFFLTNCNNSKRKTTDENNDRLELVPEPDKQERLLGEAIQKLRATDCNFLEPDTSLGGIVLRNSNTADKVIGTDNETDEHGQYNFTHLWRLKY